MRVLQNVSMRIASQTLVSNYGFDEEYLEAIIRNVEANRIKLVLIGLDPFPTGAIGIPFCKASWSKLKKESGYRVFSSLTGSTDLEKDFANCTPKGKALELVNEGIILLNSSYQLLNKSCDKKLVKKQAFAFNKFIIDKASDEQVLCLGNKSWGITKSLYVTETKLKHVKHPSARPKDRDSSWQKYWNVGCLKAMFTL